MAIGQKAAGKGRRRASAKAGAAKPVIAGTDPPKLDMSNAVRAKAAKVTSSVSGRGQIALTAFVAGGIGADAVKPAIIATPKDPGLPIDGAEGPVLKKQEFVARIVATTGIGQRNAKAVLDAALAALGDALSAGVEVNLPPLGKLKVNHARTDGATKIMILKLRRGSGVRSAQGRQGLAEDDGTD